jgi:hypothetical protein
MQKWEYRIEYLSLRERITVPNQLGLEGWELVSTFSENGATGFVFKRPLPSGKSF